MRVCLLPQVVCTFSYSVRARTHVHPHEQLKINTKVSGRLLLVPPKTVELILLVPPKTVELILLVPPKVRGPFSLDPHNHLSTNQSRVRVYEGTRENGPLL